MEHSEQACSAPGTNSCSPQKWWHWKFASRAASKQWESVSVWCLNCALCPQVPKAMALGPGEPAWLWPGEVFSAFRDAECVRWQIFRCHPCLHTRLCGSTVVVQARLLLLETKTSTPKKSFLATCGTCYQCNTCWFFVHFCCGFSNAVAILLWSGLSTAALSCELHVCVSHGSRGFTNTVVIPGAHCHLLSASLDQYLK